ncbi:MAG: hypothetical protein AAGA56_03650 [Myxococcota bacterium]
MVYRDVIHVILLGAAVLSTGCGDTFDRASEVKTVRVLGIRKTPAFARPGGTVDYAMLLHDGRPDRSEPVQVTWLGGCHNPPGDQFAGCFRKLAEAVRATASPGTPRIGFGETFSYRIPDDIITSRDALPDPDRPPYGTSFMFFAACAGELRVDENPAPDALPVGCFDRAGRRLGADDWVLGYTVSFVYDTLENAIPGVTGLRLQGRTVPVDCIDEACIDATENAAIDCDDGTDPRCIDACAADGDEDACPELSLEPIVTPGSAEVDPIASISKETETFEQVWVDYFATRGFVGAELRLISGADDGPRDDFTSRFYAPAAPGPLSMWAVVKDSRGGTSWVRVRLQVR